MASGAVIFFCTDLICYFAMQLIIEITFGVIGGAVLFIDLVVTLFARVVILIFILEGKKKEREKQNKITNKPFHMHTFGNLLKSLQKKNDFNKLPSPKGIEGRVKY